MPLFASQSVMMVSSNSLKQENNGMLGLMIDVILKRESYELLFILIVIVFNDCMSPKTDIRILLNLYKRVTSARRSLD